MKMERLGLLLLVCIVISSSVYSFQFILPEKSLRWRSRSQTVHKHHPLRLLQQLPIQRHTGYYSVRSLTLDQAVIPYSRPWSKSVGLLGLILFVLVQVLSHSFKQLLKDAYASFLANDPSHIFIKLFERVNSVFDAARRKVSDLFGEAEDEETKDSPWRPCTFLNMETISNRFKKYVFQLSSKDRNQLRLLPGQKVRLHLIGSCLTHQHVIDTGDRLHNE
jgi:hypothetical protein